MEHLLTNTPHMAFSHARMILIYPMYKMVRIFLGRDFCFIANVHKKHASVAPTRRMALTR